MCVLVRTDILQVRAEQRRTSVPLAEGAGECRAPFDADSQGPCACPKTFVADPGR